MGARPRKDSRRDRRFPRLPWKRQTRLLTAGLAGTKVTLDRRTYTLTPKN
jgi:hypothetical protein